MAAKLRPMDLPSLQPKFGKTEGSPEGILRGGHCFVNVESLQGK